MRGEQHTDDVGRYEQHGQNGDRAFSVRLTYFDIEVVDGLLTIVRAGIRVRHCTERQSVARWWDEFQFRGSTGIKPLKRR